MIFRPWILILQSDRSDSCMDGEIVCNGTVEHELILFNNFAPSNCQVFFFFFCKQNQLKENKKAYLTELLFIYSFRTESNILYTQIYSLQNGSNCPCKMNLDLES